MGFRAERIPRGKLPADASWGRVAALVAVLALLVYAITRLPAPTPVGEGPEAGGAAAGAAAVERAFEEHRSGVSVEVGGRVERLLADDTEGSPHQRFILRLPTGRTLLVAHNLDLAPRVPVERGDPVTVQGIYEWNDRGGVVHWTHHDPDGRGPGGWIRHRGEVYR